MPASTRWFIRFSFLYLLLYWCAEFYILAEFSSSTFTIVTRAGRFHLFFVGWLTQIIFGVAHWMFPTKNRKVLRGSEPLVFVSMFFLNLGLLMRLVAEPMQVHSPHHIWQIGLVLSAVMQWLGTFLFTWNIWGRIRGKLKRKKKASTS